MAGLLALLLLLGVNKSVAELDGFVLCVVFWLAEVV